MKTRQGWKDVFLPKVQKKQWTWQMIFLMCVAVFALVDSFFVPYSRDVDPGAGGEGMLFMVLGIRAASRRELPTPVMITGTCLAALVSSMNHGLLKSPSWVWTLISFILLGVVVFWGRRLKDVETPAVLESDAKSVLKISAKN